MAKVLIVGGKSDCCNLIRIALGSEHVVLVASDGQEGFVIFKFIQPDVIVVNYDRPAITGCEFVRDIRALSDSGKVKIIAVLSTANWLEACAAMLEAGVDMCLPQPTEIVNDVTVFREAVDELLMPMPMVNND